MRTSFTCSHVRLEQVASWYSKDAKDYQLPYYHNQKHFITTNSFKSDLDWRNNSEANKIRLLLSYFRKKNTKHLKTTSLLLGFPTLRKVHRIYVCFKKKTNTTVSCSTQENMMRWRQNHYPGVRLLHRRVLMPRYQWWAPQHPLHELAGLPANGDAWNAIVFTFPWCDMSPFWMKKKKRIAFNSTFSSLCHKCWKNHSKLFLLIFYLVLAHILHPVF